MRLGRVSRVFGMGISPQLCQTEFSNRYLYMVDQALRRYVFGSSITLSFQITSLVSHHIRSL